VPSSNSGESYLVNRTHVSLRQSLSTLFVLPLTFSVALASSGSGDASNPRDSNGPIKINGVKIDNLGLCAGKIYRGEQPTGKDYASLAGLGVTTIIDLRLDARKQSREEAEAAGLTYVNIPIDDKKCPTDQDVVAFLGAIDSSAGKVYVHCAGGRHRTGSMVAIYRMVRDGWSIDKAYDEMLAYDFYTRNGHKGFKTFVFEYYERMTANPSSVPVSSCPAE
jgi:protein tyrosine/serine phosphatase